MKSLLNKRMESARSLAACGPCEPTRSNCRNARKAGRLHVEGYLEMYLSR
jgi:hypothetical protein